MDKSSGRLKYISDEEIEIFSITNYVIITSAICVCGVVANIMNIVVFYKQGFGNTMNISFFGLAISDMLALIGLVWYGICANPLFVHHYSFLALLEIRYLTGGVPHALFSRITGWITVFITAERCLCITMPLKIKQIITPQRTTCIVCGIYFVIVMSFLPEFATSYFDWKFYPERNETLIGLVFSQNRQNMKGLIYILYSFLGSSSFVAVIVLTIVLVVKLKEKSKWRSKTYMDTAQSEAISSRDRKTMNMVVMIATVLIVCYTPGVIVSMTSFIEPELNFIGRFVNLFHVLWSFVFVFQAINSSVNIFLYYKMSTKFRDTFHQIFIAWKTEPAVVT